MPEEATEKEPTYGTDETPEGFIPMLETEPEETKEPDPPKEAVKPEEPKEPTEAETKEPEKEPEKPPERPMFQFVEEKATDDKKPFMVIKHLGKEVQIATEDEARNFMQKGFDYDYKVGRHGKLVQTLDQHPEFAKKVAQDWEEYVQGRAAPKVAEPKKPTLKKLDEFEDPNEWLRENYQALKAIEESQKPVAPPKEPAQDYSWVSAMVTHDPQNFKRIAPLVPDYAERFLTKAQYDRVNNDLPSLVQFYDWVKDQVMTTEKPKIEVTPKKPSFRIKSGGGEAPSAEAKPPWETKNNEDFEKYMAEIKGVPSY